MIEMKPKDTQVISADEMQILMAMHEVAQKYHLHLLCNFCGHPFAGLNGDTDLVWTVTCQCRDLKATRRRGRAS